MAKVKSNDLQKVGEAIMAAWQRAIDAGETEITDTNRDKLVAELNTVLDPSDVTKHDRSIEFDVVFDTDLDATTRLVWIAVPTPDREKSGGLDTWKKYKHDFYDKLSANDKKKKAKELATAVLFGCGR